MNFQSSNYRVRLSLLLSIHKLKSLTQKTNTIFIAEQLCFDVILIRFDLIRLPFSDVNFTVGILFISRDSSPTSKHSSKRAVV